MLLSLWTTWLLVCLLAEVSSQGSDVYTCSNGTTISYALVCDGFNDCPHGSDETSCDAATQFVCGGGAFIPQSFVCDGERDCVDGSDEWNCLIPGNSNPTVSGGGTVYCNSSDAVRCADGTTCVKLSEMCDGYFDCPDQSDESFSGPGLKCALKSTNGVPCILPQTNLLDGVAQCADGADLCFDGAGLLTGSCFQCLDKSKIVSTFQVCDGILDCGDFSDECLCEKLKVPAEFCHLYTGITPQCDYFNDFNDATGTIIAGERQESWLTSINFSCPNTSFNECVTSKQICDGSYDCEDGMDEEFCFSGTTQAHIYKLLSQLPSNQSSATAMFSNRNDTRGGGKNKSNSNNNKNDTIQCYSFSGEVTAVRCDGRPTCDDRADECSSGCGPTLAPFCLPALACLDGYPYVCDGLWQSNQICGHRIPQEELGCPKRFYCKNGPAISIDVTQVCDGVINCDDESDEAQARNCTDERFYCETRDRNVTSKVNRLFVPKNLERNGRSDCLDGSDECPTVFDSNNQFSSRDEMIKNVALKGMLWVIGPVSLVANLFVLADTFRRKRRKKITNEIARVHAFMIVNLSVADGLMGVYLMILCVVSSVHSGNYCLADKSWRSGVTCKVMGSLVMLSSEASVMILLVMGLFRFYTIWQPFEANYSKNSGRVVVTMVVLSWLIAALLAAMPWVFDSFSSHAWVLNPFFKSDLATVGAYNVFTAKRSRIESYLASSGSVATSNVTLSSDAISLFPKGWIGFYSRNGVCLPSFFVRNGEPGWSLTIAIVTFNFASFLLMVLLYTLIWQMSSSQRDKVLRRNAPKGAKLNYNKCKLQKRVTRLLLTDFLCWIPLCSMSYAYLAGAQIDNVAYAVAGIILLPINSALNPLLYSGLLDKCSDKVSKYCKSRRKVSATASKSKYEHTASNGSSSTREELNTVSTPLGTPQLPLKQVVTNVSQTTTE